MTDERLENMLRKSMPQAEPGVELNRQILAELDGKKRRRFHGKRVVVLAAACVMLLSSITVAVATIYYYSTVTTGDFYTKDYRKLSIVEEKIGCDIKFVRNFAGGYSFEYMETNKHTTYALGENKEAEYVSDYASVELSYAGENGQIKLYCCKADEEEVVVSEAEVRNIAGVDVAYKTTVIKASEISGLSIPVNGGEAEKGDVLQDITYSSASWVQDCVYYDMLIMPDAATEEEVMSMVEELILNE